MKRFAHPVPDLLRVYQILRERYGHRGWWPGETQDEIVTGAILTQSVAWANVETALASLAQGNIHTLRDVGACPVEDLAPLIRSTLYFNQKALKLKTFAAWFGERHSWDFASLFATPLPELRIQLLELKGLGPETVDSILLYAGGLPAFVCDAYTDRLLSRLGFVLPRRGYEYWQSFITARIPRDAELYKDFHAQIVCLCKDVCRKRPLCGSCPLTALCSHYSAQPDRP